MPVDPTIYRRLGRASSGGGSGHLQADWQCWQPVRHVAGGGEPPGERWGAFAAPWRCDGRVWLASREGHPISGGKDGQDKLVELPLEHAALALFRRFLRQRPRRRGREMHLKAAARRAFFHACLFVYLHLFPVAHSRSLDCAEQDRTELARAIINKDEAIGVKGRDFVFKKRRRQ